jgi:hypothetical protein
MNWLIKTLTRVRVFEEDVEFRHFRMPVWVSATGWLLEQENRNPERSRSSAYVSLNGNNHSVLAQGLGRTGAVLDARPKTRCDKGFDQILSVSGIRHRFVSRYR